MRLYPVRQSQATVTTSPTRPEHRSAVHRDASPPLLPYILGMSTTSDDRAGLAVDDLGDDDAGESDRGADLLGDALNLDLVALGGRGKIAHVDIDGDAGLLAQVPGGDGYAAGPVHDGRRHRAVDPAPRVHVVPRQRQPRLHVPPRRRPNVYPRQQEVVDRRVGQLRLYDLLNVRPDLFDVVGSHDGYKE